MKETLVFVKQTRDGRKWHELACKRRLRLLAKNKLYAGRKRCADMYKTSAQKRLFAHFEAFENAINKVRIEILGETAA